MASLEEPFDYTQPTQPFEEATQATQDDSSQVNSRQKPVGKLVWKRGNQISDHDIFLDTPVIIGRHRSCNIQVTSSVSSNRHCSVKVTVDKESKEYLTICEDLSSNGTFWNSKKIGKGRSVILAHGDVIEIKKGYYFTYLQLTPRQKKKGDEGQVDKYQITDTVLGKGTFAEIRLVYKKDTQQQMAVKIMEKRNFSVNGTAGGGTNYIHEINLLRGIRHPNIVRVYDVHETPRHVYIFMPLLRGGDLFDYIYAQERLEEDEARFIVYQVLLALKYLHDANIAHRDLKPENTLLVSKSAYSQVMLTDFGMAKATGQRELMKTMCGTFQYIAPEMISSGVKPGQALKIGYTTAVDCWSLGVMTYAMASGMLPFSDEDGSPQVLFSQILSGSLDFTFDCWRSISLECQAFIRSLLQVDPAKRMTVDRAFKHPWIAREEPRLAKLYAECIRHSSESGNAPDQRTPSPTVVDEDSIVSVQDDDKPKDGEAGAERADGTKKSDDGSSAGAMGPPAKRQRQQS
ncbi:hypothetical protein GGI25_005202 [Coemansia spiralis]|uniref:Pkinase-domain-containing protein n=2 Tax=Coemansia TaxID=4863 RepID=A0A9W8G3D0_9FUNG|nr:hypothetical protein EDC05_002952 [Coemansia umbellata]KAJ2623398.1 hypothetical protein GGI26_002436 [Coemansia sp. RSA 1358]KAJ2672275.1 hypothetical protein GGI25_005202 [Coemansia spiralis]